MKNIWQSFFKSPTSESAAEPREAPKLNKPLSDADYEYLFEQLLEGIAYGWQPGRIQRFFETLGERGEKEAWLGWWERYELKAMTAPAGNESLAQYLLKLGEQCQALPPNSTARQVGDRAQNLGLGLLSRGTLNEIWEYVGPDEVEVVTAAWEPVLESLPAAPPEENPPLPELPPAPAPLDRADWSWETLLATFQENPDFAVQVARELGLETTNLQLLATAIASQIDVPVPPPPVEDPETIFNRGVERYELEDFTGALNDWERALELRPSYYQAWNNRGLALKQLGRPEEGLKCYRQALDLEPTYYKAWYNQGIVLEELERFEAAVASYDRALELKPDYDKAWSSRGDALQGLEDWEAAVASYDRALELSPGLSGVWYQRGLALAHLGRAKYAIASFDKALELRADLPEIWTARGSVALDLKAYEEAIASFDKALQFKPEAWDAWLGRSRAARLSPAADLLLASLSAISDSSPSLNQRGEAGELASLEAGLECLYPNTHPEGWGQLHAAIGRLYARQAKTDPDPQELFQKAVGRYHEALTTLTEEAFPELHLEVLQDLIQVEWALEETARANKLLQRGTSLLSRLLDDPQLSESQHKRRAAERVRFERLGVDLAVQSGELATALELAQQSQGVAPAGERERSRDVSSWREIQERLEPNSAIAYWHLSPMALTTFILARDRAEPLVLGQPENEIEQIVLTPALRARLREARDNPARLGQIFLELLDLEEVHPNATRPVRASERSLGSWQRLQDFQAWLAAWQSLLARGEIEPSAFSAPLQQLAEILDVPAILSAIAPESAPTDPHLTLIPGNDLHGLPLPALFASARVSAPRCFPSLRTAFRSLPEGRPDSFSGLFFGPNGAKSEAIPSVGRYFPGSRFLDPAQTPKSAALAAISEGYQILHADEQTSICLTKSHAYGVQFSDNESLGIEQLSSLPLSSYYLIVLPSELVKTATLAEKLLDRGARYLLYRLWPGDATANDLLMGEFYRRFALGAEPPEALEASQRWLRTATAETLIRVYASRLRDRIPEAPNLQIAERLETRARTLEENAAKMKGDSFPYANPYYWAGFIAIG